jgi:hypothetical protein
MKNLALRVVTLLLFVAGVTLAATASCKCVSPVTAGTVQVCMADPDTGACTNGGAPCSTTGGSVSNGTCTTSTTAGVPAMPEWAVVVMTILLTVTGLYLTRRNYGVPGDPA